ncbi:MAG TPA: DUF6544 family protein, partial [Acetobacteraceae bacterium]|nr:DUF6544 family protein [Acetobacteraceae bacterium]
TGWLEARLFGSLRLARSTGPATDRGELMRYLAELPWAPHALLQNRSLSFRQIDRNSVEVSAPCADGPACVRLVFAGTDVARIEADDRPRIEGRRIVPRPWTGRFADWRELGGVRVPTRAEVSWILPSGPFECWRG